MAWKECEATSASPRSEPAAWGELVAAGRGDNRGSRHLE